MAWRTVPIVFLALLVLGAFGIGNIHCVADANNPNHYRFMGTFDDQEAPQILADPAIANLAVGQELTVTFNATNVASLGVWQVVLKYNATIMNVTSLWIPVDNVFGDPAVYPQQRVPPAYGTDFVDGLGYVAYGNVRVAEVAVTNGVLFMANCTALAEGATSITITNSSNRAHLGPRDADTFYSFLDTYSDVYNDYVEIPFTLNYMGIVILVRTHAPLVPEFPSLIILAAFMMATLLAVIIYRKKRR